MTFTFKLTASKDILKMSCIVFYLFVSRSPALFSPQWSLLSVSALNWLFLSSLFVLLLCTSLHYNKPPGHLSANCWPSLIAKLRAKVSSYHMYNKSSWEHAALTLNNKIQQVLIFFRLSSWLWNWETLRKGKYCVCLKKRKCHLKKPTILSTNYTWLCIYWEVHECEQSVLFIHIKIAR